MKKSLKITIWLSAAFILLIALCWFLFLGNRTFTVNALYSRAVSLAEVDRFDRSIRYFGWARKLAPEREDIAEAMAQTYADSGNYTKAEYTLVSAITAEPDC